jgi:hypothetical protein
MLSYGFPIVETSEEDDRCYPGAEGVKPQDAVCIITTQQEGLISQKP